MATLIKCANCAAPLPLSASGHATCRFCGATTAVEIAGSFGAAPAPPVQKPSVDPFGAKALALDFQRQHGVDLTKDAQAMERLGNAWMKAVAELRAAKKTDINLPFLTATKNGPMHYQRDIDQKTMDALYAVAKKLG